MTNRLAWNPKVGKQGSVGPYPESRDQIQGKIPRTVAMQMMFSSLAKSEGPRGGTAGSADQTLCLEGRKITKRRQVRRRGVLKRENEGVRGCLSPTFQREKRGREYKGNHAPSYPLQVQETRNQRKTLLTEEQLTLSFSFFPDHWGKKGATLRWGDITLFNSSHRRWKALELRFFCY